LERRFIRVQIQRYSLLAKPIIHANRSELLSRGIYSHYIRFCESAISNQVSDLCTTVTLQYRLVSDYDGKPELASIPLLHIASRSSTVMTLD
jgi:hypothetical protein